MTHRSRLPESRPATELRQSSRKLGTALSATPPSGLLHCSWRRDVRRGVTRRPNLIHADDVECLGQVTASSNVDHPNRGQVRDGGTAALLYTPRFRISG